MKVNVGKQRQSKCTAMDIHGVLLVPSSELNVFLTNATYKSHHIIILGKSGKDLLKNHKYVSDTFNHFLPAV